MNLASFQAHILCPCITSPLHHFKICLKHKTGAATFAAGLKCSKPTHSSQTRPTPSRMQSRWKRQHRLLDPKSWKWHGQVCKVPGHSKLRWLQSRHLINDLCARACTLIRDRPMERRSINANPQPLQASLQETAWVMLSPDPSGSCPLSLICIFF